jgi:hypothetical protein
MSVKQSFYLVTRAGGLALHRNDIGVLVEGAKADLVVFDGAAPNMLEWADPVAAVILHPNVGNIQRVLMGGKFRSATSVSRPKGTMPTSLRNSCLCRMHPVHLGENTLSGPHGAWPYTPGVNYTRVGAPPPKPTMRPYLPLGRQAMTTL